MRLRTAIVFLIPLMSCEPVEIPDQYAGRYYGQDSVITDDQLFFNQDTVVYDLRLDVVALGDARYDVFNSNGYWARDVQIERNVLKINIDPFEGTITLGNNELHLEAEHYSNTINVKHKASLSR